MCIFLITVKLGYNAHGYNEFIVKRTNLTLLSCTQMLALLHKSSRLLRTYLHRHIEFIATEFDCMTLPAARQGWQFLLILGTSCISEIETAWPKKLACLKIHPKE